MSFHNALIHIASFVNGRKRPGAAIQVTAATAPIARLTTRSKWSPRNGASTQIQHSPSAQGVGSMDVGQKQSALATRR